MKLWLDDIRTVPEGWVGAHSVDEAIRLMEAGEVEFASLDHDLGEYEPAGGDGIKLVLWMAEHEVWPTRGIRVHSANPVGSKDMLRTIARYCPYGEELLYGFNDYAGERPEGRWPIAGVY